MSKLSRKLSVFLAIIALSKVERFLYFTIEGFFLKKMKRATRSKSNSDEHKGDATDVTSFTTPKKLKASTHVKGSAILPLCEALVSVLCLFIFADLLFLFLFFFPLFFAFFRDPLWVKTI